MREPRTLEIEMDSPGFRTTDLHPFTEADLETFSRCYGEMMFDATEGNDSVEETMEDWTLVDGYLVYTPIISAIRIGRGTIKGETSWWVDSQDYVMPCHGTGAHVWRYQAHFPGVFTVEWINWIYTQWFV
ncbi:hypothetical protein [Rhodococcus sp. 27YEA6]|uniref:hypothetical protein n=1 Tax=Rhodococcus sp. 27YEA6 TaxID=3156273 RepID=UPI0038334AAB